MARKKSDEELVKELRQFNHHEAAKRLEELTVGRVYTCGCCSQTYNTREVPIGWTDPVLPLDINPDYCMPCHLRGVKAVQARG